MILLDAEMSADTFQHLRHVDVILRYRKGDIRYLIEFFKRQADELGKQPYRIMRLGPYPHLLLPDGPVKEI